MLRNSLIALSLLVGSTGCIFSSDDTTDPPDQGVIDFTWVVTQGGAASDCASAGVVSASFVITPDDDPANFFDELFTCSDMGGRSGPVGIDRTFVVSPCALVANDACLSAQGEVVLRGALVVGEGGAVRGGAVEASDITVEGEVSGEVNAAGSLVVHPTGSLSGRVRGRSIRVHEGATLACDFDCDFDLPDELRGEPARR